MTKYRKDWSEEQQAVRAWLGLRNSPRGRRVGAKVVWPHDEPEG